MNLNCFRRLRFCTIFFLCLLAPIVSGQSFRFSTWNTGNKLPGDVVYSLNQDASGYLWVGTASGLSRFDGFDFYRVAFPDSASDRYPTATLRDKKGVLWFGFNDGTVFYASGRSLQQVRLPGSSGSGISSLMQDKDGFIWAAAQKKPIFRIDPANPSDGRRIGLDKDPVIFSACLGPTGEILLGTQENMLVCKPERDSLAVAGTVEGFEFSAVTSIIRLNNGRYMAGTDGNGLFMLSDRSGALVPSRLSGYPGLGSLTVKALTEDAGRNLWVSTSGEGIFKLEFGQSGDSLKSVQQMTKLSGLPGDNANLVFPDSQGNIWIGFNGSGLSVLRTDAFRFLAPGRDGLPNNILFAGKLKNDYILGTPSGFYLFDLQSGKTRSFVSLLKETGRSEANSYYIDNEGNLWIGTKGDGLFVRTPGGSVSRFYRSGDTGSDFINDIKSDGVNIWLATLNGVNILSLRTRALRVRYNMDNGLPHNSINQILIGSDGSGYAATECDRLYRIVPDSGISSSQGIMYGTVLNKVLDLARTSDGTIWAATQGNGIFGCRGDSVKAVTTSNGLLSNYTYSILADREDNIWIGHERGISRYNPATGVVKVYQSDFANGGSCNLHAISESPDGKVLIGTHEGLIVYDRTRDRKSLSAPVNNINSVIINDVVYPYQVSYTLPYRKHYTVRINYTGIDLANPEKVYYTTMLSNYDNDWTKPGFSREVTYSLRDGKYRFSLLSVNEEGLTQDNPLSFEIMIARPVWRTWWFIVCMAAAAVGAVVLIIRVRERALRKREEYLEQELDARTAVVRKQKNEIELQNLEITDSINYAKRIQSSILPGIDVLKEHFRDAFVMFHPRDIVSGDFYWFEKVEDDRFILVCADSTGHGVPGAFMSMIGSTLLQDIVSRQRIFKPSEILSLLDKQIFSTLNQNLEVGVSNDGMDIIVCEFTNNNKHIRFASAMRPVIIVMGGETYYIKGNRASVGGQSVIEKYFDDQEYYLNEGDAIYMFSDGLPDQFGGPDGKKMKISRLKNFISQISSFEIKRQEEEISRFYFEWKGDYEQVDDILLMGVKV